MIFYKYTTPHLDTSDNQKKAPTIILAPPKAPQVLNAAQKCPNDHILSFGVISKCFFVLLTIIFRYY